MNLPTPSPLSRLAQATAAVAGVLGADDLGAAVGGLDDDRLLELIGQTAEARRHWMSSSPPHPPRLHGDHRATSAIKVWLSARVTGT